jgi:hypothetical protein
MAPAPSDTSPDAERVLTDLYRRMTPAEKLRRVAELNEATAAFARAGLRTRDPRADERTIFLGLASLRLGSPMVELVYGRTPDPHDR